MIYVLYLKLNIRILPILTGLKKEQYIPGLLAILLSMIMILQVVPIKAQLAPTPPDKEIVCFVYHRFSDSRYPSTNIRTEAFRDQLNYLAENDFKVMSLSEAVQWLKSGDREYEKVVVLTIDDGYRSFFMHGFPLLEEFGYKATVFINTVHVGNKDYMTWEQLKEIHRAGIEIGCHSHEHEHYVDMSHKEMMTNFSQDLSLFRKALMGKLGIQAKVYSYPFGEFNEQLELLVKNAGFTAACAQSSGVADQSSDIFALPRYPMGGPYANLVGFVEKSNMHTLPVKWQKPESNIMSSNPPELILCLEPGTIDLDQLQCFIHGGKECIVMFEEADDGHVIKIRCINQLTKRRTLYTITAPRLDGKGWCWHSRLWINPAIEE